MPIPPTAPTRRSGPRGAASPSLLNDDPLWYKDAIIYQVHVKSFFDANNDGVGDSRASSRSSTTIAELGVDVIWLPAVLYPSPRRRRRLRHCRLSRRPSGLRHAVRRPAVHPGRSPRRAASRVIYRAGDQPHVGPASVVPARTPTRSRGRSIATTTCGPTPIRSTRNTRHHLHRHRSLQLDSRPGRGRVLLASFYSHQPDLNFDNPAVLREVLQVMRFWLDMGIDGLRLDAVPYLVEREGDEQREPAGKRTRS